MKHSRLKYPTSKFALAAAVLLAAIAGGGDVLSQPAKGAKAPALKVTDLKGKQFDLAAEVKKGPVFVNFWATWCGPCREEMPLISDMARTWQARGVRFISVAVHDRDEAVKKFIGQQKPVNPIAIDAQNKAFEAWDLDAVPASFLVGKDGKIAGFYDQFDKSEVPAIEKQLRAALDAYKQK